MISPQIFLLQTADGLQGWTASELISCQCRLCRSIFMTPALWGERERLRMIDPSGDLQYEAVYWRRSTYFTLYLRVKHPAVMISLHNVVTVQEPQHVTV